VAAERLTFCLPGADNRLQRYAFLHYFLPFIELNVMNTGIIANYGLFLGKIRLVFKQGFFALQTRLVYTPNKACLWLKQGLFENRSFRH
jgi:hypothetical protein